MDLRRLIRYARRFNPEIENNLEKAQAIFDETMNCEDTIAYEERKVKTEELVSKSTCDTGEFGQDRIVKCLTKKASDKMYYHIFMDEKMKPYLIMKSPDRNFENTNNCMYLDLEQINYNYACGQVVQYYIEGKRVSEGLFNKEIQTKTLESRAAETNIVKDSNRLENDMLNHAERYGINLKQYGY